MASRVWVAMPTTGCWATVVPLRFSDSPALDRADGFKVHKERRSWQDHGVVGWCCLAGKEMGWVTRRPTTRIGAFESAPIRIAAEENPDFFVLHPWKKSGWLDRGRQSFTGKLLD